MNFFKRLFLALRSPHFEDYEIKSGYTNAENIPWVSIEEFPGLVALGETHDDAISKLKPLFYESIRCLLKEGKKVPLPGSGKAEIKFACSDQVESLRPFVDEFWRDIIGASYSTSFVSDQDTISTWVAIYIDGGEAEFLRRVKHKYGVDVSAYYDACIPRLLKNIQENSSKFK